MADKSHSLESRFWSKVDKRGPDECWEWTASLQTTGYGQIGIRGKNIRSSRAAYILTHGSIPDGAYILHHCDNRKCVNPAHLYAGTQADNIQDMHRRGRAVWSQLKGEECGSATLTDEQVVLILLDGRKHADIAEDYGVDRTAIGHIKSGQNWSHLRPDIARECRREAVSDGTKQQARDMRGTGLSYSKIASALGISIQTAWAACKPK